MPTAPSVHPEAAQHTPGPWSVVCASDGETYICGGEPDGSLLNPIAVMMRGDDEAYADANIMAAAPDLLAALEASPCDGTTPGCMNCDALFLKNIPQGKDAPLSDEVCAEFMDGETPCKRCAAIARARA